MARPGKSKLRKAKDRCSAVAIAAPPVAEIQASIAALVAAPPESDLVTQFTERAATLGSPLALIDALGGSRDEAAGQVLTALAMAAPDKELRKAARRALHKLRSAGLAVTLPVAEHEPLTSLVREALQIVQTRVSPSDGVGSRVLWVVMERPNSRNGLTVFNLALNDIVGLKDSFLEDMSRRRFEGRMKEWEELAGLDTVEIPVEYGLSLLSEALALNAESGFPIPREFLLHRNVIGELPPPPTDALIHQYISRGQTLLTPSVLDESAMLFDEQHEVQGWIFGHSETLPFVREYKQAERSPLILAAEPDGDRQGRAIDTAIDTLFTPPIRRGYRRRLEELAYVYWKTDRERAARQAVAAAFAITDTGSLRTHPLLRAIVSASIEMVIFAEDSGMGPPPDADRSAYTRI